MDMRQKVAGALLLFLMGCAPINEVAPSPSLSATTVPTSGPSSSPTPVALVSPSPAPENELPAPDLPAEVTRNLHPVSHFPPKMRDSEVWWADSGIRENRMSYYASSKSPEEIEAELSPACNTPEQKAYLPDLGKVFSFEGNRIGLTRGPGGDRMFLLVPVGDPPAIPACLKALKLPPIAVEDLKGQRTLVILATGQGLAEHVDHMLAQSGLAITPSASPTAEVETPEPDTEPTATPVETPAPQP